MVILSIIFSFLEHFFFLNANFSLVFHRCFGSGKKRALLHLSKEKPDNSNQLFSMDGFTTIDLSHILVNDIGSLR